MPLPIPEFPEFREPMLPDSDEFHLLAEQTQPMVSELTFTNVYVWRNYYNFRLSSLNGSICILAQRDNLPFFMQPVSGNDISDTIKKLADYLREQGNPPVFSRLPEDTARQVADVLQDAEIEEDRDNADYLYLSSDLANLPGRKYHKKKNHIARFKESHSFEYRRLTSDLIQPAKDLQCRWCKVRGCFTPEHTSLAMEHTAIMETLDNYDQLRAVGGAILIDGNMVGFTIGEPLNNDTFVIHFEKASPDYQGVYQILNQQFSSDVGADFTYINREQDLGEPGLRQAKSSYHPDHLLMKYTVKASL